MNELNEPKVTLPPAPEGMKWEYRGMGWDPERSTTYCHTTLYAGLVVTKNQIPSGITDYHYWEAVPNTLAESCDQFGRALLVADRDYWKNKCEFLEASEKWSRKQATDALDKLTKIQQIIGQQ
jgi:hypothetical protein